MIEKVESKSDLSGVEQISVPSTLQLAPDLPQMIEEEKTRDALSFAKDVLNDLSKSILEENQLNSPDADRSSGRITAEDFDLISG